MPAEAIRQGAAKTPQPLNSSGISSVKVRFFTIVIIFGGGFKCDLLQLGRLHSLKMADMRDHCAGFAAAQLAPSHRPLISACSLTGLPCTTPLNWVRPEKLSGLVKVPSAVPFPCSLALTQTKSNRYLLPLWRAFLTVHPA